MQKVIMLSGQASFYMNGDSGPGTQGGVLPALLAAGYVLKDVHGGEDAGPSYAVLEIGDDALPEAMRPNK